jgi:hypothetical protein
LQEEFLELEESLEEMEPGLTAKYRQIFQQRSGEQFRRQHIKTSGLFTTHTHMHHTDESRP